MLPSRRSLAKNQFRIYVRLIFWHNILMFCVLCDVISNVLIFLAKKSWGECWIMCAVIQYSNFGVSTESCACCFCVYIAVSCCHALCMIYVISPYVSTDAMTALVQWSRLSVIAQRLKGRTLHGSLLVSVYFHTQLYMRLHSLCPNDFLCVCVGENFHRVWKRKLCKLLPHSGFSHLSRWLRELLRFAQLYSNVWSFMGRTRWVRFRLLEMSVRFTVGF